MKSFREEFDQWVNKQEDITVYTRLSEVTSSFDIDLVAGLKCTFVNDFGVQFPDQTIMGFSERQNNVFNGKDIGRYVYLDYDCYWLPAKLPNIKLDKDSFLDVAVASTASKVLMADIVSLENQKADLKNLRILDKASGKIEPCSSGNIDIAMQSQESLKKLLSGKKVEMTNKTGNKNLVGLNKTVAGWGISAAKQVFSSTDTSAGI